MINEKLYKEIAEMSRHEIDYTIAQMLGKNASLEEDGVWIYYETKSIGPTSPSKTISWDFSPTSNLEYGEELLNEYIGKVEARGKIWTAFYLNDRCLSFSGEHYLEACMRVVAYVMKKNVYKD